MRWPFASKKRFGIFETERAGELGVVPQDGMDIEREVGAVEGKIVLENSFQHSPRPPAIAAGRARTSRGER